MAAALAFALRWRESHKRRKTAMRSAPTPAPTPIPIFAPVDKDRPAEVGEEGLASEGWGPGDVLTLTIVREVCEACEEMDDVVVEESVAEAVDWEVDAAV
jgi:hypothetical protein